MTQNLSHVRKASGASAGYLRREHRQEDIFDYRRGRSAPEALSDLLFAGRLLVFEEIEPVARLVERVRKLLQAAFDTREPREAEGSLSAQAFCTRALEARGLVNEDSLVRAHWREALNEAGYPAHDIWCDRIRLRIVPSRKGIANRRIGVIPAHKDTWGSGIMAQINWWLPLYPMSAGQSMLLWPSAFDRPIANDSATWDFDCFRADETDTYPLLPTAAKQPRSGGVPVVLQPGQLLAFSAAHLHGSVSDTSGLTRFSLDSRTVWEVDRVKGRGAANVDCQARAEHWNWYMPPPGKASRGQARRMAE